MGVLTNMTWPSTTLLQVLEDAQRREGETFDVVELDLNCGRKFLLAVVCGDKAEEAFQQLCDLKDGEV